MGGVVVWIEETKEAIRQSGSLDEATKAGFTVYGSSMKQMPI
jgi:hypothetical protein